jgi:hypothetical protein
MKRIITALLAAVMLFALSGCLEEERDPQGEQSRQIDEEAKKRTAYKPKNAVEFENYNAAQKIYDAKDSIIWCTTTWGNANAPLVTTPIRGKLTSSSVSFFSNHRVRTSSVNNLLVERRSVDGMYHGSPPPYRYGFTPGGQYVDFANMPTLCTTALTKFQREKTEVTITFDGDAAQSAAERALKSGNKAAAEKALEGLESQ